MDPLAYRVAHRFLTAGLEHEFVQRFEKLLSYAPDNPPPADVHAFRKWVSENFRLTGRVPAEAKRSREELERFWRFLEHAEGHGYTPGVFPESVVDIWASIVRELPSIVQYLSGEGTGKAVPVFEKKVGGNTYVNMVGATSDRLDAMISTIEGVFSGLSGWRHKALDGGVHVVFAGPKDFRGTAGGTYKRDKDQLWIRATPGGRIDKAGGGYGGLAYVITHELGHRYEHKHHVPFDFDRPEWHTTLYSRNDGESFAELFALSNFGITSQGQGGGHLLPTFEHLMTTGKMPTGA
jgi:hypothetical protein